jgi:hypothetical protein
MKIPRVLAAISTRGLLSLGSASRFERGPAGNKTATYFSDQGVARRKRIGRGLN